MTTLGHGATLDFKANPVQSYIGSDIDVHRTNQTRPILDGLGRLIEKHKCSLTLLRHLNKNVGGKAIYRGVGTIDFTGFVRIEMLAGTPPDHPQSRAYLHIKSNISKLWAGRGYTIESVGDGSTDESKFTWTGETSVTEGDILSAPASVDAKKTDCAEAWLRELLENGEKAQKDIEELARKTGFSWATIRRAQKNLNVWHVKRGLAGVWYWTLTDPKGVPKML